MELAVISISPFSAFNFKVPTEIVVLDILIFLLACKDRLDVSDPLITVPAKILMSPPSLSGSLPVEITT